MFSPIFGKDHGTASYAGESSNGRLGFFWPDADYRPLIGHFGPLGGILSFMVGLAAWYQVVRVIHNTDTAKTVVFMFWQVFFLLFLISLVNAIAPADLSYGFFLP